MATKEEIEKERNELKEENEKLKLRYKEVATKLEVARFALQAMSDVLDAHLKPVQPVDYEAGREDLDMSTVKQEVS